MTADDHDASESPWAPLQIRVYRALWIAGLVSNIGTFMYLAAASWAMTLKTDSPTLIGLVQTSWAVPGFLLALHAGAFADMVDRRRMIVLTQLVALAVSAVLGGLQIAGALSPAALLVGTFLESIALTVGAPAFMALTPELVGPRRLAQALGLDSISRNIAQAVGPAVAGGVIAMAGPGAVFLLDSVSFLAVVVAVRGYRPAPVVRDRTTALATVIRGGVRYVAGNVQLRRLVVRLALASSVTAGLAALLPIVATRRLGVDETGFGLLAGSLGVGSVIAAWVLPKLRAPQRPEWTAMTAAVVWSAGVALMVASGRFAVAVAAAVLAGAGQMGVMNVLFSTYTVQLRPDLRGRGSATAMLMVWLGASVGAAAWGAVASVVGVRTAMLAAAVAGVGIALGVRLLLRISPAPLPAAAGDHPVPGQYGTTGLDSPELDSEGSNQ